MSSMIRNVVLGSIALVVLFLLMATIVLPNFNTTYNYTVTGLSPAITQGLFLLVLTLALIGFAIPYLPRFK